MFKWSHFKRYWLKRRRISIFTDGHGFRAWMYDITQHIIFKRIIVILVLSNCCMLFVPVSQPPSVCTAQVTTGKWISVCATIVCTVSEPLFIPLWSVPMDEPLFVPLYSIPVSKPCLYDYIIFTILICTSKWSIIYAILICTSKWAIVCMNLVCTKKWTIVYMTLVCTSKWAIVCMTVVCTSKWAIVFNHFNLYQ